MVASIADVIVSGYGLNIADYEAEDDRNEDDQDDSNAAAAALAAAPSALDRAMIANTLAGEKPRLDRCARPAAQQSKVSIAVTPAGTVARVIVRDHVDAATPTASPARSTRRCFR